MKVIRCLFRHRFVSLKDCESEIPDCKYRGTRSWATIQVLARQLRTKSEKINITRPKKCKQFIKLEGFKINRRVEEYDSKNMRKM